MNALTNASKKEKVREEYVQMDEVEWKPFPAAFSTGGIRWKLLHVSPEMGAWTAIFDCPEDSSFAPHFHVGPGEYFLTKGRMDVRGGVAAGGDTAVAPGYGYESANARHDKTNFPVDSEFYMTFLGPLTFITPEGAPIAVIGWEEAQGAWLS
ncbi:2,4'-dihydroxyacetophenone dioxygenase family protein [Glaciimonas sp. Gout2]|uniref:2,4'-dihydroxyacetophenone dioxygenase family protein n=1 Tax=unclassified Glaciimonas TaxID=2644401 RepID=UPI002AB5DD2C|nr:MULTISPECIES: 2,4'-dihydroxyacetophenone dioxygenase family protein [unclassified Glaciimonas]MDY7548146.1 2,4'-dihydroxyacetophenone dioxygenase family protein [Glaciimonas sp. CA11.2]MEB0010339.1 2,4'-dihydroxyacetophenone dioxygenase family protein [Glaciimonas sp. Cout2]MEB0084766.1 2,4'-dihydroxyacetophenone dioxygenase family protein [Glaciimonas sp. Gout2]